MPRDHNRIKPMLTEIESIWKRSPDLRFGQLINNALSKKAKEWLETRGETPSDEAIHKAMDNRLFYIEDDELLKAIKELMK